MRVFVAGATGVIGRPLVRMLSERGHVVTGMTRSPERAQTIRSAGGEPVVCNALDGEALRAAVGGARPEAIVHLLTALPARLEPRKYKTQLASTNRIRQEGTRNLIAAAQRSGAFRIVAESVAFMYAPGTDWVCDENAPLALGAGPPVHDAVAAITHLERQMLEVEGVVLRYGFLYGPGTAFAPDGFYAELARKRRFAMIGSGEGRWSFIHTDDAASATVAAVEHGPPGVYNIVDDEPAPVRDWLPAFAEAVGAKPPLHAPLWIGRLLAGSAGIAAMTTQRGASNAKAKRELGWSPERSSWRQGFTANGLGADLR